MYNLITYKHKHMFIIAPEKASTAYLTVCEVETRDRHKHLG